MQMKPATQNYVVVGIGSNLGDSKSVLSSAISRLAELTDSPMLQSSIWKTDPVDCPPGSPMFLNAVVAFIPRFSETPETLLKTLQRFEKEFGRKPKALANAPRELDLDIIAFQTELRQDPHLKVPHPRAHERAFVMAPLAEILPNLVLPGQNMSVAEQLKALPEQSRDGVHKL